MGSSGGKGGSSSSRSPNYVAVAKEQGEQDRKTAAELTSANRPDQTDMFGNKLSWTQTQVLSPEAQKYASEYYNLGKVHDEALARGDKKAAAAAAARAKELDPIMKQTEAKWSQSVNLSPQQQALLDAQNWRSQHSSNYGNMLLGRAADNLGQPFSLQMMEGFDPSSTYSRGDVNVPGFDGSNAYTRGDVNVPQYDPNSGKAVSDALYRSVMDRAAPEQQREVQRLENQLRAQGLQPGTEAFNRAMINLQTAHGDVQTQAAQNAILGGYQEARDIYGAQLAGNQQRASQLQAAAESARADYGARLAGDQQRASQLQYADEAARAAYDSYLKGITSRNQTALTNRYLPLTEAAQFLQYAGGPQTGFEGFAGATGYNAADLTGAAQAQSQYNLAQQNASNSMKGSMLGAGAILGGSLLGGK